MSNNRPGEITAKVNEGRFVGVLHGVALIALVVGATGSLAFMFREGQQTPRLLLILFTIWVLSPFAALLWANMVSKRWSVLTRVMLYCVMLIVTLGSLAIDGELIDVRPPGSVNAFLFVAVPPASLLFIIIVIPTVALLSGRLTHRGDR